MKSIKRHAFQLSSKGSSTCEDLRRLKAHIESARRSNAEPIQGRNEGDRLGGSAEISKN